MSLTIREDFAALAGEYAVAAILTNAGWHAAMMPSGSFPGIDLMARKHQRKPISIQVKSTRSAKRYFVMIDKAARIAVDANVAADIYVIARNQTAGFNLTWEFYVLTQQEVRDAVKCDKGGAYLPAAVIYGSGTRDAWHKLDAGQPPDDQRLAASAAM